MIGSIKGKVAYLANEYCLLETNSGVGYRVFMPAAHLGQLAVGMEARVHTYMAVREDAILLFGFLNQEYYNLFLLLLGVSGVGPKVALCICLPLSRMIFIWQCKAVTLSFNKVARDW